MSAKLGDTEEAPQENVLSITRVFDAPRQLVFEAWTKPEYIKQWFAPQGFEVKSVEGQLNPSGAWRSSMGQVDGTLLKMHGIYQEIVPNEKLVFTHVWDVETGGSGHETVVTVTFSDYQGKTKMHFHQEFFLEKETRDSHESGWSECFERLSVLLAGLNEESLV